MWPLPGNSKASPPSYVTSPREKTHERLHHRCKNISGVFHVEQGANLRSYPCSYLLLPLKPRLLSMIIILMGQEIDLCPQEGKTDLVVVNVRENLFTFEKGYRST